MGVEDEGRPCHFHTMIRRIQDVRIGYKTGIAIIVVALVVWGLFSYARVKDFVPEEFKHPVESAPSPARP